jgi:hypothetical protein
MEMLKEQGKSFTDAELARRRTEVVDPGDPEDPGTQGLDPRPCSFVSLSGLLSYSSYPPSYLLSNRAQPDYIHRSCERSEPCCCTEQKFERSRALRPCRSFEGKEA